MHNRQLPFLESLTFVETVIRLNRHNHIIAVVPVHLQLGVLKQLRHELLNGQPLLLV